MSMRILMQRMNLLMVVLNFAIGKTLFEMYSSIENCLLLEYVIVLFERIFSFGRAKQNESRSSTLPSEVKQNRKNV